MVPEWMYPLVGGYMLTPPSAPKICRTFTPTANVGHMYAGVVLLKLGSFFVPVLVMLPNSVWAKALWVSGEVLSPDEHHADKLMSSVVNIVVKLNKSHPKSFFIMTGHSLGVVLASIVGTQMLLPSVVFSSPGAHFSRE